MNDMDVEVDFVSEAVDGIKEQTLVQIIWQLRMEAN